MACVVCRGPDVLALIAFVFVVGDDTRRKSDGVLLMVCKSGLTTECLEIVEPRFQSEGRDVVTASELNGASMLSALPEQDTFVGVRTFPEWRPGL